LEADSCARKGETRAFFVLFAFRQAQSSRMGRKKAPLALFLSGYRRTCRCAPLGGWHEVPGEIN
jgi:hypothetical protein